MSQNQILNLMTLKTDNHEAAQNYLHIDWAKMYNTGSVSASTDPFTSKTNKYAECAAIALSGTAAFYMLMSAAGTAVTTANGFLVGLGETLTVVVDPGTPYLRVIPVTGSATITVAELPAHTYTDAA